MNNRRFSAVFAACTIAIAAFSQKTLFSAAYIRHIEIKRLNVFDRDLEVKDRWYYRLGNRLHIKTRENVIRRELTLAENRIFNETDLEESLRNLRRLAFIGEAKAEIRNVDCDSLDLVINTEDLWTTVFGLSGEGGGGNWQIELYGNEKNLAGLGIELGCLVQLNSDKNNGWGAYYNDRRFAGLPVAFEFSGENFSLSERYFTRAAKPAYNLADRWDVSATSEWLDSTRRLYSSGIELFRFQQKQRSHSLQINRVFGINKRAIPHLSYHYKKDTYSPELTSSLNSTYLPDDEIQAGPGAGLRFISLDYDTARFLDEPGNTEDIQLNWSAGVSTIFSSTNFGAGLNSMLWSFQFKTLRRLLRGTYLGIRDIYSYRQYAGGKDRLLNTAETVLCFKPLPLHTLALRGLSVFAQRQKSDYQLLLGGDSGLRGYPDRYLAGNRLILFNAEYRFFAPTTILTIIPGAAVFFDAGNVWDDSQSVELGDLRKNIGIGLRFGLTRSSTAKIVRIDLARGLDGGSTYVSFGTGNAFDLKPFR